MASTTIGSSGVTFPDATTQSTAAGAASIPSGSVVLFYQSAAPTGWTQVTSLNDYSLRLVSGTGGTTGGTTAFSTVFANQTPTITVNVSGLSAGATTLSTTQMPSHSHSLSNLYAVAVNNCGPYQTPNTINTGNGYVTFSTSNAGGGGSHTHSISGSATGSSTAVTLNVQYANIIICSKN